ncbi:hypothetical protein RPMA_12625 [Tardiphaga alba]|uniref:Uncharacterized protein n=1 Tax=Tardiphaga alba TaxID=340268 RepID=A0ABX8AAY8_9BRAD|nr:hypothetical protein [Tardiphaga alba]QUS39588.1 hypothetical protein RPMA_12625 [Tardiphaga alba]
MTITATDLQIATLKHRLHIAREQLIKLRDTAYIINADELMMETNKVIDGAWHTLNFEMPELPSDLESRLEHQNPYKHGCNPALPMQDTSLDRLLMMFSDVADKWIESDCSPLAISALQFAIGAVRDEQFRQDNPVVNAELHQMREQIAQIVATSPESFRPRIVAGEGLTETEKERHLRVRNSAYYKADTIIALVESAQLHLRTEPASGDQP